MRRGHRRQLVQLRIDHLADLFFVIRELELGLALRRKRRSWLGSTRRSRRRL
jgi:hypothetical protein